MLQITVSNAHSSFITERHSYFESFDHTLKILETVLAYTDLDVVYNLSRRPFLYDDVAGPSPRVYLLKDNRFPTGLVPRVISFLENREIPFSIQDRNKYLRHTPKSKQVSSLLEKLPPWLYDYQVHAIKTMLLNRRGRIQSPTGSGKTAIFGQFLTLFPEKKAIVFVPTINLLTQTVRRLEEYLGEKVGVLGNNKRAPARVTVAITKTTNAYLQENPNWGKTIDILIADESHTYGDTSINNFISSQLDQTTYRFGVSATPFRKSRGDDLWTEGFLGPIILTITEDEVIKRSGSISKPTFVQLNNPNTQKFKFMKTYDSNGNQIYDRDTVYKKTITTNKERNAYIVEVANQVFYSPKYQGVPGLAIVKMREHGEYLSQELSKKLGVEVPYIDGRASAKERQQLTEKLVKKQVLLAVTSSIFNAGQDIPPLEYVIICDGGSNANNIIQQIGRSTRTYTDSTTGKQKTSCLVIDFQDNWEYIFFSRAASKRAIAVCERYGDENIKYVNSLQDFASFLQ